MAAQSVQSYMNAHGVSSGTSAGTSASTDLSGNSAYRGATNYLLDHSMNEKSAKEFGAKWAANMGNPERQAAARTANKEADAKQDAGDESGAANLRSWAAGVLGGLSISGGVHGGTTNSNQAAADARQSTSGSHDYSSSSSAAIKNSAAVNKAMQHTMNHMKSDSNSLGTSDKSTLQKGIDLSKQATQDFGTQLSAMNTLAVARGATVYDASSLNPDAAKNVVEGRERNENKGQQSVNAAVQPHLKAAAALTARARAAAASARTTVKKHPVPTPGSISHTVAGGEASVTAGLHKQQEQLRGTANQEFGHARSNISTDGAHANADRGTATGGFDLMANHVHNALSGWGPAVADSQNPDGATNTHIAGLGAAYMTTAAITGLLKNAAQTALGPGKPGGKPGEGGKGETGGPTDKASDGKSPADSAESSTGSAAEAADGAEGAAGVLTEGGTAAEVAETASVAALL